MPPAVLDHQPIAAREQDRPNLAKLEDLFEHLEPESATFRLVSPSGEAFELPEPVFHLLHQMVYHLSQGARSFVCSNNSPGVCGFIIDDT